MTLSIPKVWVATATDTHTVRGMGFREARGGRSRIPWPIRIRSLAARDGGGRDVAPVVCTHDMIVARHE